MALPKMTALHKIHTGKILTCQNSCNFVGTNSFLGVFDRECCFSIEREIFHCMSSSPLNLAVLKSASSSPGSLAWLLLSGFYSLLLKLFNFLCVLNVLQDRTETICSLLRQLPWFKFLDYHS